MNKRVFTSIIIVCFSTALFAWGKQGHQMTADIAYMVCKKSIRDSVDKYWNGMKWEDAATWMDEIKSNSSFDYMKPWHYVNVEKDKTYVATQEKNVISELEYIIDQLKSHRRTLGKDGIATDLKILFHLVGDLHQPLHVGYGEDKGGNTIKVDFLGKETNLHKFWDSEIISEMKLTTDKLKELYAGIRPEEIAKLNKVNVIEWMNESRYYLISVYDFKDEKITMPYINTNGVIIARQLISAGVRLSAVLTEIFSNKK